MRNLGQHSTLSMPCPQHRHDLLEKQNVWFRFVNFVVLPAKTLKRRVSRGFRSMPTAGASIVPV